ncbi:MAG: hypothetical protein NXI07_15180 [bacterium]|nr:hypothetical protein [bacterium]
MKRCFPHLRLVALAAALCWTGPLAAQDALPAPTGRVVLEVRGAISVTNGDGVARFDADMLQALGTVSTTTKNPWSEVAHTYSGFTADALLKRLGASGSIVNAVALNDYAVEIPVDDFQKHGAIFATHRDGIALSVRDRGPIFVIYPFDDRPDLRSGIYFDRSIWQLSRIVVK